MTEIWGEEVEPKATPIETPKNDSVIEVDPYAIVAIAKVVLQEHEERLFHS